MEIVAKTKFVRMAPRKLCLLTKQVQGLGIKEAIEVLRSLDKRAAQPILLTLKQAIGNAVNNFKIDKDNLRIKNLEIGRGPIYKHWRFVARGRVHQVQKKTSHIRLVLEGEESKANQKTQNLKIKTQKPKKKARKNGAKS